MISTTRTKARMSNILIPNKCKLVWEVIGNKLKNDYHKEINKANPTVCDHWVWKITNQLHTSSSALIFSNFCLWSVRCRQLDITPREIAADHWRYSCSCWDNQSSKNFEAVALTACAEAGSTWKKETLSKIQLKHTFPNTKQPTK